MDADRFDALTRSLATGASRRNVLRGLAASQAGLAALRSVGGEAACTNTCPPETVSASRCRCLCRTTGRPPGPDGCPCRGGLTRCADGVCRAACGPTCAASESAGPPAQAIITVHAPGGLAEILVTKSENADTVVPPFTVGTTDPVVLTATKIDQRLDSTIEVRVTDLAGNTTICTHVIELPDVTAPTCPTQVFAGPPAQAVTTFQDTFSGLAELLVTLSQNADTVVPPFTVGTTDPVVVTSTKIDQTQQASVEIRATDLAGNIAICEVDF